ncbi:hypothetical protein [Aestuariivirga sp.]|uniref:hypothetical protein n=1 Tax=Aestuariivirga sp. TaxID=2650926 RepID=UPI003594568D
MANQSLSKVTDLLTYTLAVSLAAGCLAFASYKVVKLRMMENPPPDLGLNFPAPRRKMITDIAVEVDPVTTQSVAPIQDNAVPPAQPVQPYTSEAPVEFYRLLTVIDGVAFVEMKTFRGTDIVPITKGARLPGAGTVETLERADGRWRLVAGGVKLFSERF